jgi:hypothetical protein
MLTISTAMAMSFRLVDHTIYATGAIEKGDADTLAQLVRDNTSGFGDYTVRLNSPGGLLLEGMKIGNVIRDARLETFISRDDECASACALAFLGGTRRYATGTGIGRRMEFGAALGFHGFRPATDSFHMDSETLSVSRVVTALILEYAVQMRSVDLGWLAQALNVPPEQLHYVKTPADIAALSIDLVGMPNVVPRDWYLNVCRRVVNEHVPAIDDFGNDFGRVSSHSAPIRTIKALGNDIVSARFNTGPTAAFAATLSDSDAIDLAFGNSFYLDTLKPILDAESVDLKIGAGFYYDQCIAVRSKHGISVILVGQLGHELLLEDFSELALFDEKAPLW